MVLDISLLVRVTVHIGGCVSSAMLDKAGGYGSKRSRDESLPHSERELAGGIREGEGCCAPRLRWSWATRKAAQMKLGEWIPTGGQRKWREYNQEIRNIRARAVQERALRN